MKHRGCSCTSIPQYAVEQWRELAERAVQNNQSEVDFLASCHITNRPTALKAYRRARKAMGS